MVKFSIAMVCLFGCLLASEVYPQETRAGTEGPGYYSSPGKATVRLIPTGVPSPYSSGFCAEFQIDDPEKVTVSFLEDSNAFDTHEFDIPAGRYEIWIGPGTDPLPTELHMKVQIRSVAWYRNVTVR